MTHLDPALLLMRYVFSENLEVSPLANLLAHEPDPIPHHQIGDRSRQHLPGGDLLHENGIGFGPDTAVVGLVVVGDE